MKCIECRKDLKAGEFVVLNGGAMVKTSKNGAAMGDKNLIGFLTVQNHFDSKKNYRSMIIADNCANGQFEFYACSHKCLADFLNRHIMHLAKFDKIKKISMAPSSKSEKIGYDWIDQVVELLGFEGAMTTDMSRVSDFMEFGGTKDIDTKFLDKVNKKFKKYNIEVKEDDYIWKIAQNLKITKG